MTQPYIIGICGASCSGKTTICNIIRDIVHKRGNGHQLVIINQDNYYKSSKVNSNHDIPGAIDFSLLKSHLLELKNGNSIMSPLYDHTTCTRKDNVNLINPNLIIIVEGIFIFTNKELYELFDMKIFIDVERETRFYRRMERDVKERGRTRESTQWYYLKYVLPSIMKYVDPSKQKADIILLNNNNILDDNYINNFIGLNILCDYIMYQLSIRKKLTGKPV